MLCWARCSCFVRAVIRVSDVSTALSLAEIASLRSFDVNSVDRVMSQLTCLRRSISAFKFAIVRSESADAWYVRGDRLDQERPSGVQALALQLSCALLPTLPVMSMHIKRSSKLEPEVQMLGCEPSVHPPEKPSSSPPSD